MVGRRRCTYSTSSCSGIRPFQTWRQNMRESHSQYWLKVMLSCLLMSVGQIALWIWYPWVPICHSWMDNILSATFLIQVPYSNAMHSFFGLSVFTHVPRCALLSLARQYINKKSRSLTQSTCNPLPLFFS